MGTARLTLLRLQNEDHRMQILCAC